MSTLAEIEEAIEKLPNEQLFQLTDCISERFSDAWDRQIEQDIVAGKLDDLAAEAIAEHRAGQSLPMPKKMSPQSWQMLLDTLELWKKQAE
jgi:hypothetical protein